MSRAEALGRNVLWFTLLVSLAGFLGYYDADGFVAPPPVIVLGLQVVGGLLAAVLLRDRLIPSLRGIVPLLLVAVWAAATLMWADDPVTAMRRWVLVFAPGLLLCALAASDPRPRQTFVWFAGVVVVIVVASGIFSGIVVVFWETTIADSALRYFLLDLGGWQAGISEGGRQYSITTIPREPVLYIPRYSGLTSNPNSLSLFAAIATIALGAYAPWKKSAKRYAWILLAALVVFVLLLSGSRAAVGMAVIGILCVFLLQSGRHNVARVLIVLILGAAAALYISAWFTASAPDPEQLEVFQLRGRAEAWRLAMLGLQDIWPTGFGFGLTEEVVYRPLGLQTAAHSLALTSLLEIGVIGFALILFAWFQPVFRATRTAGENSPLQVAIVALLMGLFVHQVVDSSVFRYHWAHFVFVYLIGASAGLSGSRTSE